VKDLEGGTGEGNVDGRGRLERKRRGARVDDSIEVNVPF